MRTNATDAFPNDPSDASIQPRPIFFISDSTGITAETLGNTLLTQFGSQYFTKTTLPFVTTTPQAQDIVAALNALADSGPAPVVFSTVVTRDVRAVLGTSDAVLVDLFGSYIVQLEQTFGVKASAQPGRAHGLGNDARYQSRMTAVEYAMEHDDGQSLRALEKAEVILVAPSRCGKTPTTMYLALQHGIFAANFPLVDEDFGTDKLPRALAGFVDKCFGLTSTPLRLSQIRTGRRPASSYASLRQCEFELRHAEGLYRSHGIPHMSSVNMSVEEMSAVILQRMNLRR